jgi:hypothetical protein
MWVFARVVGFDYDGHGIDGFVLDDGDGRDDGIGGVVKSH